MQKIEAASHRAVLTPNAFEPLTAFHAAQYAKAIAPYAGWEELCEKALPNHSFPSLDLLIDQLCEGLKGLAANEQRVRSMVDFPYRRINTS